MDIGVPWLAWFPDGMISTKNYSIPPRSVIHSSILSSSPFKGFQDILLTDKPTKMTDIITSMVEVKILKVCNNITVKHWMLISKQVKCLLCQRNFLIDQAVYTASSSTQFPALGPTRLRLSMILNFHHQWSYLAVKHKHKLLPLPICQYAVKHPQFTLQNHYKNTRNSEILTIWPSSIRCHKY